MSRVTNLFLKLLIINNLEWVPEKKQIQQFIIFIYHFVYNNLSKWDDHSYIW